MLILNSLSRHSFFKRSSLSSTAKIPLSFSAEELMLHTVCFRSKKSKIKNTDQQTNPPVNLEHMSPQEALESAKELSLGVAVKILRCDMNWKSALLYSKNIPESRFEKKHLKKCPSEMQAYQNTIKQSLENAISKLTALKDPSCPERQAQLTEVEIKNMLAMLVYLHKVKENESPDSKSPFPKPEDVLVRYVRGQCHIVKLQKGDIYQRFHDLKGNRHPFVIEGDKMSADEHAFTTTERSKMEVYVTVRTPQDAHAIYGIAAQRLFVSEEGNGEVETLKGGGSVFVDTPTTARRRIEIAKESSVDPLVTPAVRRAIQAEAQIQLEIDQTSQIFLMKWDELQSEIAFFEKETKIFSSITTEINRRTEKSLNKEITEEDLCFVIESLSERRQDLGERAFTEMEKIAILVNYEAIIMAQQLSLRPFVASGLSIVGDILNFVPVIGYGSLAFSGLGILLEYSGARKQHITLIDQSGLSRGSNDERLDNCVPWHQKILSKKPHPDTPWWRELKAAGPQRIVLEGLKWVPGIGIPITVVSLVAEVLVIGSKLREYRQLKHDSKLSSSMKAYEVVRTKTIQKESRDPRLPLEIDVNEGFDSQSEA